MTGIVYVADSVIPSRQANAVHVMQMCAALAEIGHRVDLVAPDRNRESERDVLDVWEFYGVPKTFGVSRVAWPYLPYGTQWAFAVGAMRAAASLSPALIYTRSLATALVAGVAGMPVLLEAHQPADVSGRFSERALRTLARRSELRGLVVITQALAAVYEQGFPELRRRVHVIPDAARPIDSSTVPADLGVREGRLQVGYAGQLYEGRGIQRILDLARALPSIDFNLVGGLARDVKSWKERSMALPNVRFAGFVPPRVVAEYLLAFDVLIAPYEPRVFSASGQDTTSWMSPLKLFEYMAAARPIVTSDLPALREVVDEGSGIIMCAYDDFDCWVETLSRLSTDPGERTRRGAQAFDRFSASYSWRARAERVSQLLLECE